MTNTIIERLLSTPGFILDSRTATTEGLRSKYCPEVSYSQTYRAQQIAKGIKTNPVATVPKYLNNRPIIRPVSPIETNERYVFFGDSHCPFVDPLALEAAVNVIQEFKPTGVYLLGDMIDCYAVSRFDRDPQRVIKFQEEIDSLRSMLEMVREAAPNAAIHYLLGNHEARISKWLHAHPEVSSLACLEPETLFGLDDLGITCHSEDELVRVADHVITHGSVVKKGSGSSARGQIDNYLTSGISGHTHRAAHVFRTSLDKTFQWIEAGCLTVLKPEYIIGPADWQQAVVVGNVSNSSLNLQLVPIKNGEVSRLW